MFIKSLQIGLMGFFLCAANAWAGPASIQGIVKDAQGKPIKGADVRVESKDGKQLFNTVKTDSQGRYISQGLQPGVYRVSLVVNGAVKAAIGNTKTKSDQATQLNFDLKPVARGQATHRAKEREAHGLGAPEHRQSYRWSLGRSSRWGRRAGRFEREKSQRANNCSVKLSAWAARRRELTKPSPAVSRTVAILNSYVCFGGFGRGPSSIVKVGS